MEKPRFIRKNGKIIPVRPRKNKKGKSLGSGRGAAIGAAAGASYGILKNPHTLLSHTKKTKVSLFKRARKTALIGAAAGSLLGSLKFYKAGKGESDMQLARRIAGKNKSGV